MSRLAPLPHERAKDTVRCGLVSGATLEERIRAARAAKAEACGAVLLPTRLKAALEGVIPPPDPEPEAPRRRCADCGQKLPLTEFYRAPKTGYLGSYCRECNRRRCAAYRLTERARAARAAYFSSQEVLDRRREQRRAKREALRAAGLPTKRRSLRSRLVENRRKATQRLARTTDPERRAKTAALILNLTAEIDRIDRNS